VPQRSAYRRLAVDFAYWPTIRKYRARRTVDNLNSNRSANEHRRIELDMSQALRKTMDTEFLIALLKQLNFSAGLPDAVLTKMAALAMICDYRAGSKLFREGSEYDRLLIIIQGRVALDMHVPGRPEVRILSLGPGDVVAWSALIGNGRMTTSAVALKDTQVVSIQARDLLSLCEANHSLGYHVMRQLGHALADRLVATRLQLLDLFADNPPRVPLSSP
jgi:CRP/FNR family transcriptional regulator, cyclic AMP receptor protein